jgi:hypothetical protein
MPRSRRSTRHSARGSGQKYSSETSAFEFLGIPGAGGQVNTSFVIVPPTTIDGVRKAKNFTKQANCMWFPAAGGTLPLHLQYVLVFVPEGLAVNNTAISANPAVAVSIYEPNQYVIAQGIFDTDNSLNLRTRLARNLHAGDQIGFVIHTCENIAVGDAIGIWGNVNFAITYSVNNWSLHFYLCLLVHIAIPETLALVKIGIHLHLIGTSALSVLLFLKIRVKLIRLHSNENCPLRLVPVGFLLRLVPFHLIRIVALLDALCPAFHLHHFGPVSMFPLPFYLSLKVTRSLDC